MNGRARRGSADASVADRLATYCTKAANRLRRTRQDVETRLSLEHLSGPRALDLAPEDVAVVCLVKNGSCYMENFLRHYRSLGVAHFIFVDNGSTDDTVEKAAREAGTTVVRSTLPFNTHQTQLRSSVAKRFAMGSWCICADIDELLDFHHAGAIALPGLTRYLSEHGYTCAVGQMLDLLPDSEASLSSSSPSDFESSCPYYDLSCLESFDYLNFNWEGFDFFTRDNTIASSEIKWLFGGVRRKLFGTNVCLTKHPITRISKTANPYAHPHCASNVRCADISVLIRHYKFVGDFRRRIEAEVTGKVRTSGELERYLEALQASPDFQFLLPSSRRYAGTEELVAQRFLVTSPTFEKWASEYSRVRARR